MGKTVQEMINECVAAGGKMFQPNGLRIRAFRADGNMYEHEHGDHPDYKFPVEALYIGTITSGDIDDCSMLMGIEKPTEAQARAYRNETHALIYSDGHVAVTLYECNYALWSVRSGDCLGGRYAAPGQFRLSDESLAQIRTRSPKKARELAEGPG